MKGLICVLMSFALCLTLVSCTERDDADDGVYSVVTTVFPPYDYAVHIAAEAEGLVEIRMLLPPGSESHDYEPSIEDLALVAECDLFICVGGETDAWVEDVVEAVGGGVNVMRLTEQVELLCAEEHCHDHGHGHGEETDEHVWTTPSNAALLCRAVEREMCLAMPELAESFMRCGEAYAEAFENLNAEYKALSENARRDILIFADRFPFRYLTESLGLRHHAAFSGCSSDTEPSLSVIFDLTEEAKDEGVPVVLTAELSRGNTASAVASECGAVVRELHSCHNVSREDFERGVSCLELMRRNLEVLKEALG